jgi:cob(I)alamin adenosyltransferase
MERIPLIVVYTGNGKGKTTAAMGLLMRCVGHGGSCSVIQFIKKDSLDTGEKRMALRLGVPWKNYGAGFTWKAADLGPTIAAYQEGWELAKTWIAGGTYDMVVLDEFTYGLAEGYLDQNDVLNWISSHKSEPQFPHLVITGRNAPQKLIQIADLVSELVEVKHPWREKGIKAQKMIEY